MTLEQRSEIVNEAWPERHDLATHLLRCVLVAAVDADDKTPTLSPKERAVIETAVRKVSRQASTEGVALSKAKGEPCN
jgi:hypothetical protein